MAEFDQVLLEAKGAHKEFQDAHNQYQGTEAIYRRALEARQQARDARRAILSNLEGLIKQLKRER